MVTELEIRGHPNPWELSPHQVLWRFEVLKDVEHREYRRIAGAVAVHKKDEAAFKAWQEENED